MASEENQRRNLKRRRETYIDRGSTSSSDSNSVTKTNPVKMSWTMEEIKFLRLLLSDYAKGDSHWDFRGDYWNNHFWLNMAQEYNRRVHTFNTEQGRRVLNGHNANEVISKAVDLRSEFTAARAAHGFGTDMEEIFGRCEFCYPTKIIIAKKFSDAAIEALSSTNTRTTDSRKRRRMDASDNNYQLNDTLELGESSHGNTNTNNAQRLVELLDALKTDGSLSFEEYFFLVSSPTLVQGLWPTKLLDMGSSKEDIITILKEFYAWCKDNKS